MNDKEIMPLVSANTGELPFDIRSRVMKSHALHRLHAQEILRLARPEESRTSLASSAIVLAAEHHGAIAILITHGHISAAHALARPLMETTIRAIWLIYFAKFEMVKNLSNGTYKPDLDDMCRKLKGLNHPAISPIADSVLSQRHIFHSFAHAGIEQIDRRIHGYSEEEVLALLFLSDTFAAMAMALAAVIFEDEALHELTETTAHEIALEAHSKYGTPSPTHQPTERFPPMPNWQDPAHAT
jgi:hypothetical protein